MSESKSHKRIKKKAAGKSGKTEKKLKYGGRIDAWSKKKATEYERSGTTKGLTRAVRKLKRAKKEQRILRVPNKKDVIKAKKIARKLKIRKLTIRWGSRYYKP